MIRPDMEEEKREAPRPQTPLLPKSGGLLALAGRTALIAVFSLLGAVIILDMLLTVIDPARPMTVAHLAFAELARLGAFLAGIF